MFTVGFRRMDQQVYDRGSLTASVDSSQDLTEEEVETYALLDGFVLRTAQIDQQQRNLEHADYQYSKKIEEEVAKRRFNERGQPARDVGRQLAEKIERIDAEYGEEVQSLADMTDSENIPETVEQVAQELFPRGEADITDGRIAALLSYCYRLIKKLFGSKTVFAAVATVGVIGLASIILYKVFVKIDFFKWLMKKGGWAILRAGYDAVDAVRNSVSRSWLDYFRNMMGAGVALVTSGTRNLSTASTVAPPNVRVMPALLPRAARHRTAFMVLVLAASVGSVCYWWRRRSR